jgi:hypothetical protein
MTAYRLILHSTICYNSWQMNDDRSLHVKSRSNDGARMVGVREPG